MPGAPSSLYSSVRLVLTPVSLVWSPLFAGYYAYLAGSVSLLRVKTNHFTGEGDNAIHGPGHKPPASTHDVKKLKVAVRAHANYGESVPFNFLLLTLAELNGAPSYLIHLAYGTLFSLRVAHNEFGMKLPHTAGLGRLVGYWGSVTLALLASVYNFTLGQENLARFLGL